MVSSFSEEHEEKAPSPTRSRDAGKVMPFSEVQAKKACVPMVRTLVGKVTCSS